MIIYEIKNKINGKIYIGQHSSNELNTYYGSGKLIKYAIDKYGIENFERTILEICSSKDELNEREKYWIKEKNSIINGYNLTDGGTGGDNSKFIDYSDEWKEKQRKNTKNFWDNLSDDDRNSRREKLVGVKNPMFGKKGFWKGKKIPKEIVEKQLNSRKSYKGKENPNWKGGISKNKCKCGKEISSNNKTCSGCRNRNGKDNPFFGKQHSEETKNKLSENRKGKKPINMKQVNIDNVTYESLAEASRQTGIPSPTILWRINSKNKKYENYNYI
jgi:group I intron endonuclease